MVTRWLGRQAYRAAWDLQRLVHSQVAAGALPDTLLLVEHDPVITLGKSGDGTHLLVGRERLAALGVDYFEVERAGDVTYHGPGQAVVYPIVKLTGGLTPLGFLEELQGAVIDYLAELDLEARPNPGYAGVFVGEDKICAFGIAVRRRTTFHGLALNVKGDLSNFGLIDPCGISGAKVTSLERLGVPADLAGAARGVSMALARRLGRDLLPASEGTQ